MEIVYSSSDSYSICTAVSLFSLYQNNADIEDLNVYILSTDITPRNKNRLSDIAHKFNRDLNIIDAKQDFIDEAYRLNLELLRGAYNTYSRVVLNRWFGHLDKIMVIDSDTLVTGSIKEAWDLDISNYMLAAVPELAMYCNNNNFEDPALIEKLAMYYNMGICVVNLKKWRDEKIDDLIVTSIRKDKPAFKIADQSIINTYVGAKITRLPLKFNYYSPVHNISYGTILKVFCKKVVFSEEEYESAKEAPAIIHYFGHSYERPWFKHSRSIRKSDYLRYRKSIGWGDVPMEKWRKSPSLMFSLYDCICYCLLCLNMYETALRFRYIWGQKIKNFLKTHR